MVHILSDKISIVNEFLRELRDKDIQKDRARFRKNIERIGQVAAYELSKKLKFGKEFTHSPLGIAQVMTLIDQPIIATILRAGLPLQQGLSYMFDQADLAYISAFRKHHTTEDFDIVLEYVATPNLENRVLILCDPMVATGKSIVQTYKALLEHGKPKNVFIVSVIGSQQGVEYVTSNIPEAELYIGVVDKDLNKNGYIVPGLGDAGDLSFGEKE